MKRLISNLLLLALLFTSCAKKAGETSAKFGLVLSGISSLTGNAGGAMLWGRHDSGSSFGVNVNNISGDLTLDLKNGSWSFYMTAWDGSGGAPLGGVVKCAFANEVFEGGDAVVNLSLLNSTCSDSRFGNNSWDDSGTKKFNEVNITACSNLTSVVGHQCNKGTDNNRGSVRSYRLAMPDFIDGDVGGVIQLSNTPLRSDCFDDADNDFSNVIMTGLNIPAGNGIAPFKTVIESFFGATCDGTKGVAADNLKFGLHVPSNGSIINGVAQVTHDPAGPNKTYIHHKLTESQACDLSNQSIISIGSGSVFNPFRICTPIQFNSIGGDSTILTSNLKVSRDLDFSGQITGIFAPLGDIQCGDLGSSIQPIGGLYSDMSGCTSPTTTSPTNSFSGVFDGNNKTLKNIFLMEEDFSMLGVFRQVSGSAIIKKLTLDNIEVEGNSYIGALAGDISSASEISNIVIKNAYVDSRSETTSMVGTVAGSVTSVTTLTNIHTVRSEVEGRGDYIGGLFGILNNDISIVSFFGKVESDGNSSPGYIGGIAGEVQGSSVTSARTKGSISGKIHKFGGLFGSSTGTTTLQDTYSEMFLSSNFEGPSYFAGGLTGVGSAGLTINDSYFNGNISINCVTNDVACNIGNITGDTTGTINNSIAPTGTSLGGDNGTSFSTYSSFISVGAKSGLGWTGSWDTSISNLPPKLNWETSLLDPCLDAQNYATFTIQSTNGRGSLSNPISICDQSQLTEFSSYSNMNFIINNVINLSLISSLGSPLATSFSSTFNGALDGNGFLIHSGTFSATSSANFGFFNSIGSSGKVTDLKFASMSINTNKSTIGIVAGTNDGVIKDVEVLSSAITGIPGSNHLGGIVGINNNLIEDTIFNYGIEIQGGSTIGGIAGLNNGTIRKVRSNPSFSIAASNYNRFGGVVGKNSISGVIDQADSGASIEISGLNVNRIGGIVGENLGKVYDAKFNEHGSIQSQHGSSPVQVGGIIGKNGSTGELTRSISLGGVFVREVVISSDIGTIVGDNVGTINSGSYTSSKAITLVKLNDAFSVPTFSTDCDITLTTAPKVTLANADSLIIPSIDNFPKPITAVSGSVVSVSGVGSTLCTSMAISDLVLEDFSPIQSDNKKIGIKTSIDYTTPSPPNCDITFIGAHQGATGDYLVINDFSKMYQVTFIDAGALSVVMPATECGALSSSDFGYVTMDTSSNTTGTFLSSHDLTKISTFCPSAIYGGSASFKCPAGTGWDIIEDSRNGTGNKFLRDMYKSELLDLPPSTTFPNWAVEDGGYPELLFDW